jgi:hypothetical protein
VCRIDQDWRDEQGEDQLGGQIEARRPGQQRHETAAERQQRRVGDADGLREHREQSRTQQQQENGFENEHVRVGGPRDRQRM